MSDIFRAENISMYFGGFRALSEVSVAIPDGRLTAIIGPNGAGKSTFFNVMCGAYKPTKGDIFFQGEPITGLAQYLFARRGIAKSYQITNLFPQLTALENVRIAIQAMDRHFDFWTSRGRLSKMTDKAAELLDLVGLREHKMRHAENLSHGEQRSLEIAVALGCEPKLLLLDEPTAGMSPEETVGMMDLITRLSETCTVALVEHKMKLVMNISNHLIVLHHGELLAEGTPEDIRGNEQVRRVYLGYGDN